MTVDGEPLPAGTRVDQHPTDTPSDENSDMGIRVGGVDIFPGYSFGRGKRLTQPQRETAVGYLVLRDGPKCRLCGQELADPSKFDIDHIDGNRYNHTAANLRLLCHKCNARIGWAQKQNTPNSSMAVSVSQGRGVGAAATASDRDLLAISRRNEAAFRKSYYQQILSVDKQLQARDRSGSRSADPALLLERLQPAVVRAVAREEVGNSRASALSYEERLFALNGPLELKRDDYVAADTPYLGFRDRRCYSMEVEQIEALYPVEGQLYRRSQEGAK